MRYASVLGARSVHHHDRGLATDGDLSPLQEAWIEAEAPQCGYCQSGQLMTATALLKNNPTPTDDQIRDAMSGNLCRCGTYNRIFQAIRSVADANKGA